MVTNVNEHNHYIVHYANKKKPQRDFLKNQILISCESMSFT